MFSCIIIIIRSRNTTIKYNKIMYIIMQIMVCLSLYECCDVESGEVR